MDSYLKSLKKTNTSNYGGLLSSQSSNYGGLLSTSTPKTAATPSNPSAVTPKASGVSGSSASISTPTNKYSSMSENDMSLYLANKAKSTPPTPSVLATPQAQSYIQSQYPVSSPTVQSPVEVSRTAREGSTSTGTSKTSPESSYIRYLTGMYDEKAIDRARTSAEAANKRLANTQNEKEARELAARREYEALLDSPGGLRSGAQESASLSSRRNNSELADLALRESAAARTASVYNTTLQNMLSIGKTLYEAERDAAEAANSSGFTLSEGQVRYDSQGNVVASGGTSSKDNEVLTPSEATALGVPYGTTRAQAYGVTPTKPLTEAQSKAGAFAIRTDDANKVLNSMEAGIASMNPASFLTQTGLENTTIGNAVVSNEIKQVKQAERNFLNAVLRRESGAVISPTEFSEGAKQYFPRPGDDTATLQQKARNRSVAIATLKNEAGSAYSTATGVLNGNAATLFAEEW